MQRRTFLSIAMLAISGVAATAQDATLQAISFRSTDGNYWHLQPAQTTTASVGRASVTIRTDQPAQTFKGWGTCFNELDYDAWRLLADGTREGHDRQLGVGRKKRRAYVFELKTDGHRLVKAGFRFSTETMAIEGWKIE